MRTEKDYEEFLELLNKHKVRYCIIGSYAMAFHERPRYTKDIDVLIETSSANAKKILAVLDNSYVFFFFFSGWCGVVFFCGLAGGWRLYFKMDIFFFTVIWTKDETPIINIIIVFTIQERFEAECLSSAHLADKSQGLTSRRS